MLRPVIMIGCGGSGQKSVRYVRDAVRRHLEHAGWEGDFPRAWQFLGLDTLNMQESPGEIPTLPNDDFKSVSLGLVNYTDLDNALLARHGTTSQGYKELIGWRPAPNQVAVPLQAGAGQMRGVGRAAGIVSLASVVRPKIQEMFTECAAGAPELERVSEFLGVPVPPGAETPSPIVVVLGSMAGGTGAGIMLDVIDLVRRTNSGGAFPAAVIFSPDIFNFGTNAAMAANGLALMSELMSSYWDNELSGSELIPSVIPVDNRGPHSVFLIGRKNMDGVDLGNSGNVYRAVGETLATWVTSYNVQQVVMDFITTNWTNSAIGNAGGYPFGLQHQPGVVSSFGSSTLSIGRDRFRDYTQKLLMRETIDHLHEGHRRKAIIALGNDADNLTEIAQVARLVEDNFVAFLEACQINEAGTEANQIQDCFLSRDMLRAELSNIKEEITSQLVSQQKDGKGWQQMVISQANIARKSSSARATSGFDHLVIGWGPEVFNQILRTTSVYVGKYGLKVASGLVRAAQEEVNRVAAEVQEEARQDSQTAAIKRQESQSAFGGIGGGRVGFESSPVQAAVDAVAKAVAGDWRASRREGVVGAMTALSSQVLAPLMASLEQASGTVFEMVSEVDGEPALVDSWPQYQRGIPNRYLPSPVEFFLEEPDTWPGLLEGLTADAAEMASKPENDRPSYQASNNIDATRFLIISGDFASTGTNRVPPMVWSPTSWSPGGQPEIRVDVKFESLEDRVKAWMNRPEGKMARTLGEGLREYLSAIDSAGRPVPEHTARLRTFRQKLGEAVDQSRPLIEIDIPLNSLVHSLHTEIKTTQLVQGFPFAAGHPARETVEQVIRNNNDSFLFSDNETESVLISSFIDNPVHPMVVTSLTQPLKIALDTFGNNAGHIQSSFWGWRRTKTLEDFVPLPDEVRLAVIRGFAVARLLGYITTSPSEKVVISGESGPIAFPFPLLTNVSRNNILPALLESFSLCFAEVSTRQLAAFDAYKRLHELGEGTGHLYELAKEAVEFIKTGQHSLVPVDKEQAESMQADSPHERRAKMMDYLKRNLAHFQVLSGQSFTGQEYRTQAGSVVPEDTLTLEILQNLIDAYEEVANAIIGDSDSGVVV